MALGRLTNAFAVCEFENFFLPPGGTIVERIISPAVLLTHFQLLRRAGSCDDLGPNY